MITWYIWYMCWNEWTPSLQHEFNMIKLHTNKVHVIYKCKYLSVQSLSSVSCLNKQHSINIHGSFVYFSLFLHIWKVLQGGWSKFKIFILIMYIDSQMIYYIMRTTSINFFSFTRLFYKIRPFNKVTDERDNSKGLCIQ